VRFSWGVVLVAVALGIVFPQWALVALLVIAIDKFVIRKVPRLRRTFGQS
jgi:uncharacterized iron-regulated membrane protein